MLFLPGIPFQFFFTEHTCLLFLFRSFLSGISFPFSFRVFSLRNFFPGFSFLTFSSRFHFPIISLPRFHVKRSIPDVSLLVFYYCYLISFALFTDDWFCMFHVKHLWNIFSSFRKASGLQAFSSRTLADYGMPTNGHGMKEGTCRFEQGSD